MWHRLILRIALSAAHVFGWIFVFQFFYVRSGMIGGALGGTALTYALAQAVAVLLTPLSAQRLRHGFKRTLVYAVVALACSFVALAAAFSGISGKVEWGIGLFALFFGLYRALYWIPYEVIQARAPMRRGMVREIILALIPAAAGIFLASSVWAPVALLCAAAVVTLAALIPLYAIPDGQEGFSWNYRQTFHELFAKQRRAFVASAFMGGIEAAALLLLWPLLVFMVLRWSYPMLGIVVTLTYLVTIGLHAFLRKPLAQMTPRIHAVTAISAWVMRLTVGGAIGVVLVDTFFYTGSRAVSRGIDIVSFEQAADSSTYIDEHTALKEVAMGLGRIVICILVAILASVTTVSATYIIAFACAAIAAVASVYLTNLRPRVI